MEEIDLVVKLREYPELKQRVEQLLTIVENAEGETTLANEAERQVIEQMRGMGHDALQSWANQQSKKVTERVCEQKRGMRRHLKKNCSGIRPTEK